MSFQYTELNIGKDAAEQEEFHKLKTYFLKTKEFNSVEANQHHFILGHRGTGKSAILKIIEGNTNSTHLHDRNIYITPEKYSYSVLKAILDEKPIGKWGQEASFASAWKFTLITLVLKDIVKKQNGKFAKGPETKIHNYLRDNHANVDFDGITIIYKFIERMQSVKAGEFEVALSKAASLQKLYKLEELDLIMEDFFSILNKQSYNVLIDELDNGWDGSEFAQFFIAGLFSAAQDLNKMHKNLNIVVSLRQDIFEGVPSIYSDQEKIRDQIVSLKWTDEALIKMANERLRVALRDKEVAIADDEDAWSRIFVDITTFKNTKSKTYIIERTLYRPRDLIQFLKAIFKTTEKSFGTMLDYNDILEGETLFSEGKVKDLAAEFQYLYPGVLKLMEFFRGQTYVLTRSEIETQLLEFACSNTAQSLGDWAQAEPEKLIAMLYEIGFIKAYLAGAPTLGRKGGSGYYGNYEIHFKPNLNEVTRFQISLVFRQYLRLKQRSQKLDLAEDD